ncbi:MAG: hypothetical protein QM727_00710 [Niabella sp.]
MSRKKIALKLIFISILFGGDIKSQTPPTILLPSPDAQIFFQNINHPVSHSTGVLGIDIPIFTIQQNDLSIPISISYNASGRRVTDQTGPVGLGWSLNAGGMISRKIYNKPDDKVMFKEQNLLKHAATIDYTSPIDIEYLLDFDNDHFTGGNIYDGEYDIYSYSVNNLSGKFIYYKNNAFLIPQKPYKITGNILPSKIVDDFGTVYLFEKDEYGEHSPSWGQLITSRNLTSIISANLKDTILFQYKGFSQRSNFHSDFYQMVNQKYTSGFFDYPVITSISSDNFTEYQVNRIKNISFKNGAVNFISDEHTGVLQKIEIRDDKNIAIKTIEFVHEITPPISFYGLPTPLQLSYLIIKNRTGQVTGTYRFEYYPLPAFSTKSQDYWGYYNGSMNTNTVPVNDFLRPYTFTLGNRDPFGEQIGMLKKIVYPTGGYSEFEYENNIYRVSAAGERNIGPGMRIKSVKTTDTDGKKINKVYKYGVGENGYGEMQVPSSIMYYHMSTAQRIFNDFHYQPQPTENWSYRKIIFGSSILPEYADAFNEPICYSSVTEYMTDGKTSSGKTIYRYENNNPYKYSIINYIPTEFYFPPESTMGQRFSFEPYLENVLQCVGRMDLWRENLLVSKEYFKHTGSAYLPIKRESFDYRNIVLDSLRGFRLKRYLVLKDGVGDDSRRKERHIDAMHRYGLAVFKYADYYITTGRQELKRHNITNFQ